MKVLRLEILGKPTPLSRTGAGQFGAKWVTAPSSRQIGLVIDAWERGGRFRFGDDEPLKLTVHFISERPASHFGTGRNAGSLKSSARRYPAATPDLDNLVKLICDALQGNAFKNDSRVVTLEARKAYGEKARTLVEIWAI